MKSLLILIATILACGSAVGQHQHAAAPATRAISLLSGLGDYRFPVSTRSAEARKFFDQGMILVYGFNHDEAARSFRRAAELDPDLAMAHWGLALALAPNYNQTEIPAEKAQAAYNAIQKATSLATRAPEHERAYIAALAQRFSANAQANQRQLSVAYKNAMSELRKRYPDDLDAATLYADSAMILNAWKLWSPEGKPAEGTEEVVSVLESVIRRDPTHIGAHHLYIHVVEASQHPERGLASADLLGRLSPAAGHLVHMPAHIYMRVGDYEAAARSNEWAARADRSYIEVTGARGIYPAAYFSHNLHFLAAAHSMQGRHKDAVAAARQLEANLGPYLKEMPFVDSFLPTRALIEVRFGRWDEVMDLPKPDGAMPVTSALWHWSRGMAHAAKGRIDSAQEELKTFTLSAQEIPANVRYGQNTARDVLKIAEHFLNARIAARGDRKLAVEFLRKAVAIEDSLAYDEPPGWYHPLARESLGGALMLTREYAEAERVFREDLRRNRRNGRSLFGLTESLKAQGREYESGLVRREFERAWRNADTQLRVEDL